MMEDGKRKYQGSASISARRAFTLVELVVVIAIIAFLVTFATMRTAAILSRARTARAEADLVAIRSALVAQDGGYLSDMRGIPGFSPSEIRLANLLVATNLYVLAERNADGTYTTAERADPRVERIVPERGLARSEEFLRWSEERRRGWRGPYIAPPHGVFPAASARRHASDATALERGFYPSLASLYLADDWRDGFMDCSVYGFPGEPAVMDPWGNPYVLQIPPPQAFSRRPATVAPDARWQYARLVSAGPDGILDTPCFYENKTNATARSGWNAQRPRASRQAGRLADGDTALRGDDIVLFINRSDIDEGEDAWDD